MRFVVDAQLPPALSRWLEEQGHIAEHVYDLDMARADDRVIWELARSAGAAIVTKDEDFAARRSLAADGPPIVWVRCGNTNRRELLTWFRFRLPAIVDALARGESIIEIA